MCYNVYAIFYNFFDVHIYYITFKATCMQFYLFTELFVST